MILSMAGLAFIAHFEGKRLDANKMHVPYNDAAGHATVGYGHLLHKGPLTIVEAGKRFTETEALAFLRLDVKEAEVAVKTALKPDVLPILTQNQFDALVSFFFNLGLNDNTFQSLLIATINAPVFWRAWTSKREWARAAVAFEFGLWVNSGGKPLAGLVVRRAAEAELFNHGVYAK